MLNLYFLNKIMKLVLFSISLFLLSCSSSKLASKSDDSKANNIQSVEKKPVVESKNTISNNIKALKKDELKPGRTEEIKTENKQQTLEKQVPDAKTE